MVIESVAAPCPPPPPPALVDHDWSALHTEFHQCATLYTLIHISFMFSLPPTFRPSLNLFHSKLVVYCSLLSLVYIFYTCALKKKKTLISFIVSKSFILLYTFGFLYCLFSITDFLFISLIVNFHTFISVFNSLFVYFILFFIYLIFFFSCKM